VSRKREIRVNIPNPSSNRLEIIQSSKNNQHEIPNQSKMRLDEKRNDESSIEISTSKQVDSDTKDFKWILAQMKSLSWSQNSELQREAANAGRSFPVKCVNRGVLFSESCISEEEVMKNIPLIPSKIMVSVGFVPERKVEVFIENNEADCGPQNEKEFVRIIPPCGSGLTKSHITRIVDDSSHIKVKCRGPFKYDPNIPLIVDKDFRALAIKEDKIANASKFKAELANKQQKFVGMMQTVTQPSISYAPNAYVQALNEPHPQLSAGVPYIPEPTKLSLLDVIPESMEMDSTNDDDYSLHDLSEFNNNSAPI
jgi:hypothetical protein